MILVLAPSVGGKSTLMRYLRDATDLKIAEIDEELLASNNNVWPDSDLIHSKLIPEIMRRMARSHYDIFFSKDTPAELVSEVKASGVKVVVLNLTISQLLARNTKRMSEEGYDDASPWLEGQLNQLIQLENSGLVDATIDGDLSTEEIASQIISMLELNTDIEIKDSSLNGKGVFAKRLIKKDEVIFTWHPKVLTKEEVSQLPEDELKHYTYPEGDTILWMQPPERYINHSCEPNTIVVNQSDVASKDIMPNEEITSDYIDVETENFTCRCGSTKCRGFSRASST